MILLIKSIKFQIETINEAIESNYHSLCNRSILIFSDNLSRFRIIKYNLFIICITINLNTKLIFYGRNLFYTFLIILVRKILKNNTEQYNVLQCYCFF